MKSIIVLLLLSLTLPLYALDNAGVARQKAKEAQVTNVAKEKDKLWCEIELMINSYVDKGKFEVQLSITEYKDETVVYVVKKLVVKGYIVNLITEDNYKYLTISW
jgi:hypothetical protein